VLICIYSWSTWQDIGKSIRQTLLNATKREPPPKITVLYDQIRMTKFAISEFEGVRWIPVDTANDSVHFHPKYVLVDDYLRIHGSGNWVQPMVDVFNIAVLSPTDRRPSVDIGEWTPRAVIEQVDERRLPVDDDGARSAIRALIQSAVDEKTDVFVVTEYLNDPVLGYLLKASSSVQIHIVADPLKNGKLLQKSSNGDGVWFSPLREVDKQRSPARLHCTLMFTDKWRIVQLRRQSIAYIFLFKMRVENHFPMSSWKQRSRHFSGFFFFFFFFFFDIQLVRAGVGA
jgi:hypothetical protein